MQFRNVLVLAAHPDDEMGCAGLIERMADEGADITLLTFSQCSDLNGPELVREWMNAADLLGIKSADIQRLPNRNLAAYRNIILDILDGREADLILTPATFDEHQDHTTVTQEAIRAFKHSTILGYELPLNTVREHRLQAYAPCGLDVKLAHAALYTSQAHKPYMDPRYIEGLSRMRGVQCGAEFAEAFEVIRWVI